jgi:L-ascorbate metabolism protein UlaG (beta-lactamase superfamily)
MTTTDAGLRIEYFRDGDYIRVYAVPSAHPTLDYTPLGGYPHLGYLIRCGGITIYHAGDSLPYDSLADSLRPYSVTVAILPVDGPANGNFTVEQASTLAEQIGAQWLVPMHYGTFAPAGDEANRFIDHMLFHRPSQRFKIFHCGEGWTVPED